MNSDVHFCSTLEYSAITQKACSSDRKFMSIDANRRYNKNTDLFIQLLQRSDPAVRGSAYRNFIHLIIITFMVHVFHHS